MTAPVFVNLHRIDYIYFFFLNSNVENTHTIIENSYVESIIKQYKRLCYRSDALVSRNSATTKYRFVWHYLRDPTFRRFYTIPKCDRHTHTHRQTDGQIHDDGMYCA